MQNSRSSSKIRIRGRLAPRINKIASLAAREEFAYYQ